MPFPGVQRTNIGGYVISVRMTWNDFWVTRALREGLCMNGCGEGQGEIQHFLCPDCGSTSGLCDRCVEAGSCHVSQRIAYLV